MKFRPARSSGPIAGAIGVLPEQHDGYMMFAVAFGILSCVWPSPMAWPISCSSTRVKFCDWRNEPVRPSAKITYARMKPWKVFPLTVPPVPKLPLPPPIASVPPLISLLGSSNVITPLFEGIPPLHGPLATLWSVVPAYCRMIDAEAGAVHAERAI